MNSQPNFNLIARPYRWLEYLTLGPILQNCRTHFLPLLLDRKQALVLGDGDGRFLAKLLTRNPTLQADAVDTSATMLRLLRNRCEAATLTTTTRLRTHNRSALDHSPSAKTDLITAHFFFDCLPQQDLDTLIVRIAPHTSPNTLWLISDFRIPSGPMSLPAKLYIRSLYLAFCLLTGLRTTHLPDHEIPLRRAGLTRTHQRLFLFGLLTTEIWSRL
ncbi:methyltransferase [Granulicella arctica]|uniref:SAM-dependent methyltransferase n=1 Tax=Granulicella arctica TaxID=940613 RepID=A0A7Y9TI74_9BACT|nr:class I SAM-dependent methyltransferase [Granulicella arctica]NYF81294.1 SAM-dependent methyltransferase [Granulicella arctica]